MDAVERRRMDCTNREEHTEGPRGYVAWHEWAEEKRKTHKQHRCPGCKLWLIWKPKP